MAIEPEHAGPKRTVKVWNWKPSNFQVPAFSFAGRVNIPEKQFPLTTNHYFLYFFVSKQRVFKRKQRLSNKCVSMNSISLNSTCFQRNINNSPLSTLVLLPDHCVLCVGHTDAPYQDHLPIGCPKWRVRSILSTIPSAWQIERWRQKGRHLTVTWRDNPM